MESEPLMIATPGALRDLVERAGQSESIALDTEFVWDRTYYPRLGVVQVALSAAECHLVDTVALDDLSPLGELLAAPDLVKILHDAPQDLTILRRVTGAFPRNIFDTRLAAGLAGLSSTTSLRELVGAVVGVDLAKTESRTDWVRRPLTDEQLAYAVEDVCYLQEVRRELLARSRALERQDWLREELATLDDSELYAERDPRQQYLRVKGSGRASRRELAILRELAAWREQEAQRCDRPRNRVVPDATLIHLARRRPHSRELLGAVKGLGRRYEETVLELVGRGLAIPDEDCPRRRGRRRRGDEERIEAQLDQALAHLRARSTAHSIDSPFVASRAELHTLVCDGPDADPRRHRLLRGWRRDLVGGDLLDLLAAGAPVK